MEGGGAGSVADTLDLYEALALFRFMDMHPLARELTWSAASPQFHCLPVTVRVKPECCSSRTPSQVHGFEQQHSVPRHFSTGFAQ